MSIETRVIRRVIGWLATRYPYLVKEAAVPSNAHIHLNPGKRAKA